MSLRYSGARDFRSHRLVRGLADVIWPPRSLLSDAIVDRPGVIEALLWAELDFLCEPMCVQCGFPLPDETGGENAVCGACAARTPAYDSARAALVYDDNVRKLALDLKRGGRRDGLSLFSGYMAEAGRAAIVEADVLAPVPMHWLRLAQRGFNQAAWLTQALGRRTGKPVKLEALRRKKKRRSQEGLSASERRRNVQGAFAANGRFDGLNVVVVDDVFTTGATLEACARALKRAGALRVHGVTLARVVRPVDATI